MTDEHVAQFVALTGCTDAKIAKNYLEMSGSDINMAIGLYMETGGNSSSNAPIMEQPKVRAPIAAQTHNLMGNDTYSRHSYLNQRTAAQHRSEYSGDWERHKGKKNQKLANLFSSPDYASLKPLDSVCDDGIKEDKWILVNIQSRGDFHCHALNRDIWKHPQISELVKSQFIFCQYDQEDPWAKQYCQLYNVFLTDTSFPYVAILTPITRSIEKVLPKSGKTFHKPDDFQTLLVDFLAQKGRPSNVLGGSNGTTIEPTQERKPSFDVDNMSIDAELEKALAMSMMTDQVMAQAKETENIDPIISDNQENAENTKKKEILQISRT